jgi:hypothetical protein
MSMAPTLHSQTAIQWSLSHLRPETMAQKKFPTADLCPLA